MATSIIPAPRLVVYFNDYAEFHKHPRNKACHYIGIPSILVSLLGLLGALTIGEGGLTGSEVIRLDGGTLLLIVGWLWYLLLDWKIAVPFAFISAGCYFLGRAIPVPVLWGIFVVGWVFQGIGHAVYEKKSPAFTKNLVHLLIGPLWIFGRLIHYGVSDQVDRKPADH